MQMLDTRGAGGGMDGGAPYQPQQPAAAPQSGGYGQPSQPQQKPQSQPQSDYGDPGFSGPEDDIPF